MSAADVTTRLQDIETAIVTSRAKGDSANAGSSGGLHSTERARENLMRRRHQQRRGGSSRHREQKHTTRSRGTVTLVGNCYLRLLSRP